MRARARSLVFITQDSPNGHIAGFLNQQLEYKAFSVSMDTELHFFVFFLTFPMVSVWRPGLEGSWSRGWGSSLRWREAPRAGRWNAMGREIVWGKLMGCGRQR